MKYYGRTGLAALVTIGFLAVAGVSAAAFYDETSVTNRIETGDVDISISEYEIRGNRQVPYQNEKIIMPGDTVSKIPRITCHEQDCWVRANIRYINNQEELDGLSDKNLLGIGSDWVKRGEYYYLTHSLTKNETADLFQGVSIPENWDSAYAQSKFGIEIRADAIQATHFNPDFEAMSPWGNQEIELCVHEREGAPSCRLQDQSLKVEFNGRAHRLLAVPSDFFTNLDKLMPGDTVTDTVQLSNTTDNTAELFFASSLPRMDAAARKLLDTIQLQIRCNGRILYKGPLSAGDASSKISLGSFASGESSDLTFQISFPSECKNEYARRAGEVIWTFSVEEPEAPSKTEPDPSPAGKSEKSTAVQTGDPTDPDRFIRILIVLASGMFLLIPVYFIRDREEEES